MTTSFLKLKLEMEDREFLLKETQKEFKTIKNLRDFFNNLDSRYDNVPIFVVRKEDKFIPKDEIFFSFQTRVGRFDGNITDETFLLID